MNIYLNRDGKQLGPYSEEEVRRQVATGQISAQDWAWPEGTKDWVTVQQLLGSSTPALPITPPLPGQVQKTDNSSLWTTRLITAFFVAGGSFLFLFIVFLFFSLFIGAFIVGLENAASEQHQAFSENSAANEEAGRAFGQKYGALFMGLSALASFVCSLFLAWLLAFWAVLPWCRAKRNS